MLTSKEEFDKLIAESEQAFKAFINCPSQENEERYNFMKNKHREQVLESDLRLIIEWSKQSCHCAKKNTNITLTKEYFPTVKGYAYLALISPFLVDFSPKNYAHTLPEIRNYLRTGTKTYL